MRRHGIPGLALGCFALLVSCKAIYDPSDFGDGNASTGHLVQIASAVASPAVIDCGNGSITSIFNVQLVNTTSSDVTLVNVSSTGIVVRAAFDTLVGRQVYMRSSLPFTPTSALVRANDGNVTVRATLDSPCPNLSVPTPPFGSMEPSFADIYVTLYLTTNSGQYTTTPVVIHHTWR